MSDFDVASRYLGCWPRRQNLPGAGVNMDFKEAVWA